MRCALTFSKYKVFLLLDHTLLGNILLSQRNYVKFLYSLSCKVVTDTTKKENKNCVQTTDRACWGLSRAVRELNSDGDDEIND